MTVGETGIAAAGAPARTEGWRAQLGLAVMLGGVAFNMLLLSAISSVLPTIAPHFGTGRQAEFIAQSIITFSGLGIIAGGLIALWLGGKLGLRRLLLLALTVYGISGSAGLFLDSAAALLTVRVLQGMSSAWIGAATFAMIGNRFEGPSRARILGYQGSFVALAGTVTLSIAGFLARDISWRAPFGLYLLAFVALAMGLVAIFPKADAATPGEKPQPSRALFALWRTYLMIVPLYVAAYMFFLQFPFVLKGDGVTDPVMRSNVMMAITVMNFIGGLFYGRILERIGTRWMFVLILGTMAASHFVVGAFGGIPAALVACGLAGLGGGSLVPYITNLVLTQATPDMRARAVGFQYTVMYVGDFMNPLIVTPLRGWIGNHEAFAVIGAFLAAAALVQAFMRRPMGTAP